MAEEKLDILIKAKDMYSSELSRMKQSFAHAGTAIATFAGSASTALFALAKQTANTGEEIGKWSKITGVSVEELSRLRYITQQTGGEIEDMYDVLKETAVKMKEAQDGTGGLHDNLKHLGVQVTDTKGNLRDTESVFYEIVDALASMENATLRTAIADEIWSDAGTKLLPTLIKNKEELQGLRDEADKFGVTISQDAVDASKKFNENLREMQGYFSGIGTTIGNEVIPIINKFFQSLMPPKGKDLTGLADEEVEAQLDEVSEKIENLRQRRERLFEQKGSLKIVEQADAERVKEIEDRIQNINESLDTMDNVIGRAFKKDEIEKLKEELQSLNVELREQKDALGRQERVKYIDAEIKKLDELQKQLQATIEKRQQEAKAGRSGTKTEPEPIEKAEQLRSAAREKEISLLDKHLMDVRQIYKDSAEERDTIRQAEEEKRLEDLKNLNEFIKAEREAEQRRNEEHANLALERHRANQERRKQDLDDHKNTEMLKHQATVETGQAMMSFLESMNAAYGGKHREYFEALKVARSAEAMINAHTAASRALADYPQPYSYIAAGAIYAAGLARVYAIQQQQFNSASAGGGGGGGGNTAPPAQTEPTLQGTQTPQSQPPNITVEIHTLNGNQDWDRLIEEEIAPAIERAQKRNVM